MTSRGSGCGLSAQVAIKIAGKRDLEQESEILAWIEAVLKEKLPSGQFEDILRDGTILCRVLNKIKPGSIPKIHTSGGQFKMLENLENFNKAIMKYGVAEIDLFQSVDLFEKRNIPQVAHCIMALGRACYLHPEWTGPFLGPKPAEENKRNFTVDPIRAGEGFNGFY